MPSRAPGPLEGSVTVLPNPGSRYLQVTLAGDSEPVPAFLPASVPLVPHIGMRLLLDMVGGLPVVRCDAP